MKILFAVLAALGTVALIVILVAVSFWLGTAWNRSHAQDGLPAYGTMGPGMMGVNSTYGPGMMDDAWNDMPCAEGDAGDCPLGPDMMDEAGDDMPCAEGASDYCPLGSGTMGHGW